MFNLSAYQNIVNLQREIRERTPNNLVFINKVEDFPNQDASKIILESDFEYFISAPITTNKFFEFQNGVSIVSVSPFTSVINYTGGQTMFQSLGNASAQFRNIRINAGTANLFGGAGTTFVLGTDFQCTSCNKVVDSSVVDYDISFTRFGFFNVIDNAIEYTSGDQGFLSLDNGIIVLAGANAGIELGSAVFNRLDLLNVTINGPAGSVGISGLPASANIQPNRQADIRNTSLVGVDTPLSNISQTDVRWGFSSCDGVQDSQNGCEAYLNTPTIVDITVAGQFELINSGNWLTSAASRFSVDANGVATYNGELDLDIVVSGTVSFESVTGNNQIACRIAYNGVDQERSGAISQNGQPVSAPVQMVQRVSNGDTISLVVTNNSNTTDVSVERATLIITAL